MVKNKDTEGKLGIAYTLKYTGAILKLLQLCQRGSVNFIHGIVEVKLWPIIIKKNPRFFTEKWIYFLAHIIREAYMIPATLPPVQYWFVNNYIDCDQFNILYDKDFEKKKTRIIDKIACQFK